MTSGVSGQDQKSYPGGRELNSTGHCTMPKVTFTSFILSLNTSALFHLGDLAHPETGEKEQNLELARHAIDTLSLLAEKTRGNLETDEEELLTRILYELRMRFVRMSRQNDAGD